MAEEKVKLGGMALQNGVLVHGPRAWAAAVRLPDGRVEVAAALKRFRAAELEQPFLRGPARLFEALAVLPELRRRLPQTMPLSGLSIGAVGNRVVVREGSSRWRADSGQYVLDFEGDPAAGSLSRQS